MVRKKKPEMATVTFRMDKRVWKEAKKNLNEIGVSRSQFIGTVLREMVRECKQENEFEMIDRIKDSLLFMGSSLMVKKRE